MKRRAFTLVELLVVIGIISLLISILLPSLSRARAAAQKVACGSNLRQVYLAWMMYADDNKGMHCRVREDMGTWPNADFGRVWWFQKLMGAGWTADWSGVLKSDGGGTQYLSGTAIVNCPAGNQIAYTWDSGIWGWYGNSMPVSGGEATFSYGYFNPWSFAFGEFAGAEGTLIGDAQISNNNPNAQYKDLCPKFFRKNLRQPDVWPLFYDSRVPAAYQWLAFTKDTEPYDWMYPQWQGIARHNGRANIVYADGHVGDVPVSKGGGFGSMDGEEGFSVWGFGGKGVYTYP